MDEYYHTRFSGKRDWQSRGIYWWIGNMNPDVQFSTQLGSGCHVVKMLGLKCSCISDLKYLAFSGLKRSHFLYFRVTKRYQIALKTLQS